jgi:hypothetical protein
MLTPNILAWGFPLTVFSVLFVLERMGRLRRLRRQRVYADLAALSWVQFEQVIVDAFRQEHPGLRGRRPPAAGRRPPAAGRRPPGAGRRRDRTCVSPQRSRG